MPSESNTRVQVLDVDLAIEDQEYRLALPQGTTRAQVQVLDGDSVNVKMRTQSARSDKLFCIFSATNPSDGDTIVINGETFEFDNNASVGAGNHTVTIGAAALDTAQNLAAAVEVKIPGTTHLVQGNQYIPTNTDVGLLIDASGVTPLYTVPSPGVPPHVEIPDDNWPMLDVRFPRPQPALFFETTNDKGTPRAKVRVIASQ